MTSFICLNTTYMKLLKTTLADLKLSSMLELFSSFTKMAKVVEACLYIHVNTFLKPSQTSNLSLKAAESTECTDTHLCYNRTVEPRGVDTSSVCCKLSHVSTLPSRECTAEWAGVYQMALQLVIHAERK